MSKTALRFMGRGEPERFRCRVYDATDDRLRFLRALATDGVLDAPAFDAWTEALHARRWVRFEMERAPGGGRHKRWRLTSDGREALAAIEEYMT